MELSSDLLMQFAKVTKAEEKTKKETTVYGTAVKYNGGTYVRFDGSELLTPVITSADFNDNERVSVLLKDHTATITGNLSAPSARNKTVSEVRTNVTKVEEVLADTVRTKQLQAESARIDKLEASDVDITGRLTAAEASIKTLTADSITVEQLKSTFATIENLDVEKGRIDTLESGVADIDTLIFGSATGTTIQTSFANSVIAQLGDAQIKSAMIQNVSASKITAGDIITNNVRVKSQDGSLIISDETMQISDSSRVRVQIGKDASNDYSINIWDASGNLMFSKGGITDSAIKEAIIRNDMVSDTANIAAHKLDIDSLFEEINGSTNTIKSTRVYLDDKKQTLAVAFKSLDTTVTSQGQTVSSQGTAISTIQGQISSKIWQQDITTAKNEMTTQYSTLTQNLNGFKAEVGSTYATASRVSTLELTANGLTAKLNDMTFGGRNYFSNKNRQKFDANNEFTLANYQSVGSFTQFYNLTVPMKTFVGKKCILSFDCISPNGSTPFSVYNNNGDARYNIAVSGLKTPIGNTWTHQEVVVTVADRGEGHVESVSDKIEMYASEKLGVKVKNVKFEIGTKATDWTPAPEDVAGDISNASKTATNYLNFSTNGLVVGDMTASSLGKNVLIDSEAVKVRTGTTVNAVFGGDIIELAKDNESATISMLKGAFKIYYDADSSDGGFGVYGLTTSGKERLAFQPVNENNNLTLGWGGYADKANSTNLYGHKMYLTTNEDIILNPGSGTVQIDGNIVLSNGKNLFGKRTDGAMRTLAILNASNQMLFGYGSYINNEGSVYYDGNDVNIRSKTDIRFTTTNETVMLQDGDGNATYSAFFRPNSNAKCTLGTNANRWYAVYASNATIQTSDIREKENVVSLSETHSALFDKLRPVQYNFIDGNGRTCYGLIAQEVISAMSELGIGEHELDLVHHDMGDDETNDTYGLAYTNLIAMLIYEVQKLKREVAWRSQNG